MALQTKPSPTDKPGKPVAPGGEPTAQIPPPPGDVAILARKGGFPPAVLLTGTSIELVATSRSAKQKGAWSLEQSGRIAKVEAVEAGEQAKLTLLAPSGPAGVSVVFTPKKGSPAKLKFIVDELKIGGTHAAYLGKKSKLLASAGGIPGTFTWTVVKGGDKLELPAEPESEGPELMLKAKARSDDVRIKLAFTPDPDNPASKGVPKPPPITRKLAVTDRPVPRICVKDGEGDAAKFLDPPARITAGTPVKLWAVLDKLEEEPAEGIIEWRVGWSGDQRAATGDRRVVAQLTVADDGVLFTATDVLQDKEVRLTARLMKDSMAEQALATSPRCTLKVGSDWKPLAKTKLEAALTAFFRESLASVRTLILDGIKKLDSTLREGADVAYTFDLGWLQFLDPAKLSAEVKEQVRKVYEQAYTDIRKVTAELKAECSGVIAKLPVPTFFKSAFDDLATVAGKAPEYVDGFVREAANAMESLPLAEIAGITEPAFVGVLRTKLQAASGVGTLAFRLRRLKVGTETMLAVQVDGGLFAKLSTGAAPFANLDGHLYFLFTDLGELAEAIFVKALVALGIIQNGDYDPALDKLITQSDRQRLQRILNGRVRLEVNAQAGTFSPAVLLDKLKVQGTVGGSLIFDYNAGKVALDVSAAAKAHITVDGHQLDLALDGDGSLKVDATFDSLWTNPDQGFKDLLAKFVSSLDVKAKVKVTASGTDSFQRGLVQLAGTAYLSIEFDNRQVTFAFGGGCAAIIEHDGHHVKLGLGAAAGAKFTLPAASELPTFSEFWEHRQEKFPALLDQLAASLDRIDAALVVTAEDSFRLGIMTLKPTAGFSLQFHTTDVRLKVDAGCDAEIAVQGKRLALSLSGAAGAGFSIRGGPKLSELWTDPRGKFPLLVGKIVESLEVDAKITAKAAGSASGDAFTAGFYKLSGNSSLALAYKDGDATFDFTAAGAIKVQIAPDQPKLELKLASGAHARLPIRARRFKALWDGPDGELEDLIPKLGTAFEQTVRAGEISLGVKADGTFKYKLVKLTAGAQASIRFRGNEASFNFGSGFTADVTAFSQQLSFRLDADAGLTIDTSSIHFADFWAHPKDSFKKLLDDFPSLIKGEAFIQVNAKAGSKFLVPVGDGDGDGNPESVPANLQVEGGVRLGFTSDSVRLHFGVKPSLVIKRFSMLELAFELTGDVSVRDKQLKTFYDSPKAQLQDTVGRFVDLFEGHLRVAFAVTAKVDDVFLMPAIQQKLHDWNLASAMASAKIVANFWNQGGRRFVVLAFEGVTEVTTTLPGNIGLRLEAKGVTQVVDRTVRAFARNPDRELSSIADEAAQRLASTLKATVSWFGMELGSVTASIEDIMAAHQFFTDAKNGVDGAWDSFFDYVHTHLNDFTLPPAIQHALELWNDGHEVQALLSLAIS